MTLSLILDVLVAGLLATTIVYAMLLSRRLGALRNDKAELEALVRSLDESARRAQASVTALKSAADEIGQDLQRRVDQGKTLRTDLSYVIDLGGNLADRLEGAIRSGRDEAKDAPAPAASEPVEDAAPPRRRPSGQPAIEPVLSVERRPEAAQEGGSDGERSRVTGFPSRAERLLRRALEARH